MRRLALGRRHPDEMLAAWRACYERRMNEVWAELERQPAPEKVTERKDGES